MRAARFARRRLLLRRRQEYGRLALLARLRGVHDVRGPRDAALRRELPLRHEKICSKKGTAFIVVNLKLSPRPCGVGLLCVVCELLLMQVQVSRAGSIPGVAMAAPKAYGVGDARRVRGVGVRRSTLSRGARLGSRAVRELPNSSVRARAVAIRIPIGHALTRSR